MYRWLVFVACAGACHPSAAPPATSATATQQPPASKPLPRPAAPTAETTAQRESPNAEEAENAPIVREQFVIPIPQLPAPGDAVAPSRIRVGEYRCKISREYRFRPCTVALDEHGRSILTIPHALIALQGVLTDEGRRTNFDGVQTDPRPYGCPFCAEGCAVDPDSCACKEGQFEVLAECVMQPIRFAISKRDEGWRGKIEYHLYYGQPDPERDGGWAYEVDFLSFVMRR